MIVTFTPTEGDSRVYEFKPRQMPNSEAEQIEALTGKNYAEAVSLVQSGHALARRALVYVFEKRVHPTLSWKTFDFPYGAVEVEFDRDEFAAMSAAVASDSSLDETARAEALAQIAELAEDAPEVPKAPAPSDVSTT
jgi:hypothetical protein